MHGQLLRRTSSALQTCRWSAWLNPGARMGILARPTITIAAAAAARPKIVLGIETSCDDTGAAVVTTDGRVLGEALAGQVEIHAAWGETQSANLCVTHTTATCYN